MENKEYKSSVPLYVTLFSMLVLTIVLIVFMFVRVDANDNSFESTNTAMGTYVHQTVYSNNGEQIVSKAMEDIYNLENLISWRIDTSDIAKVNKNSGDNWVDIDPKTSSILSKSLEVSKKSMGALDVTILPVSLLWGFDTNDTKVPGDREIQENLKNVNYKNLKVNLDVNRAKLFKENMGINLGAVGKGAACDEVVSRYKKEGAKSGIVAIGGSIGVFGTKPNKADWRIAIRDPFKGQDSSDSMAIIPIKSGYVSTSGAYEKNFYSDGEFYHHILDPKTGYPSKSDLASVTVWSDSGLLSDLLSTACFVLGRNNSLELLKYYNASAVFIDNDKKVFVTDGLKDNVIITNQEYVINQW